MTRKILIFVLFFLLTINCFSQNVINSRLEYHENLTVEQFNRSLPGIRSLWREIMLSELDNIPDYVLKNIYSCMDRYYGNRSPRIGDTFTYISHFSPNIMFVVFFRINQTNRSFSYITSRKWL